MTEQLQGTSHLVVGGAGFVGGNLVQALLAGDVERVVVVDNLLSAERENVPDDPRVLFLQGSIAVAGVLAQLDDAFDYVFHLATFHGNQNSIHDPLADHENNTLTTLKLFERLKSFQRLKKIVYAGAGCAVAKKTFDEAKATSEDAPLSIEMDSPYSISKLIGEYYAVYYHRQHKLPAVRARFQNVYGPGEILGAGSWRGTAATIWRNVTPTFVFKALHGEPLPVDGDGAATRDFIFVDDIVRGLLSCAVRGNAGDVYNLASGQPTSIKMLAELINELTENDASIQWQPRRSWDHSGKRFGSTEKSKLEFGFETKVELREGLRRTVEWTRENLDRIQRCIEKHARHLKAA